MTQPEAKIRPANAVMKKAGLGRDLVSYVDEACMRTRRSHGHVKKLWRSCEQPVNNIPWAESSRSAEIHDGIRRRGRVGRRLLVSVAAGKNARATAHNPKLSPHLRCPKPRQMCPSIYAANGASIDPGDCKRWKAVPDKTSCPGLRHRRANRAGVWRRGGRGQRLHVGLAR